MFNVRKSFACEAIRAHFFKHLFVVASLLPFSLAANAVPSSINSGSPYISSSATISLNWSNAAGAQDGVWMTLAEKVGSSWVTRCNYNCTNYSTSKSTGTYEFRLTREYWEWEEYCHEEWGCWDEEVVISTVVEDSTVITVAPLTTSTPTDNQSDNADSFVVDWGEAAYSTQWQMQRREATYPGTSYPDWSSVPVYNFTSSQAAQNTTSSPAVTDVRRYQYRVRACIDSYSDCGSWSGTLDGITTLKVPAKPAVPTMSDKAAGSAGLEDQTFRVNWAEPSGYYTESYILEWQSAAYGSSSYGGWSTIFPTTSTYSQDENKTSDGNYQYQVTACNESGCSSPSDALTVQVLNPPSGSGSTGTQGGSAQFIFVSVGDVLAPIFIGNSLQAGETDKYVPDPTAPPSSAYSQLVGTEITAMDEVGSIPGSFRVDESGGATYSIPIFTVPGTAGVTPEVSLNYSSNGGNGLVGLGWSVGGLSSITRCRQTLGQDGGALPIQWDDNDVFCLDGQRLLLVSGTYGHGGSTYRTEIDSFATVTAYGTTDGDPDYFTVESKDGSIAYYGNSANKTTSASYASLDGANGTLVWAISEFQDNVLNAITYEYGANPSTEGHRISKIKYAFGTPSSTTNNAVIEFSYAPSTPRGDKQTAYVAGEQFSTTALLTDISVQNKQGSTWNTLRTYDLRYQTSANDELSRLYEIEECVGSSCLPVTSFTWATAGLNLSGQHQETLNNAIYPSLENHRLADIDGDGFMDVVFIDVSHKLWVVFTELNSSGEYDFVYAPAVSTGASSNALQVFDYNGDGRQDVAVYCEYTGGCGTAGWKVHLSEPQSGGGWRLSSSGIHIGFGEKTVFADMNGDGLADAINGDSFQKLQRNTSDGTSTPYSFVGGGDIHLSPTMDNYDGYDDIAVTDIWGTGDFNGDGRMDIVGNVYFLDCDFDYENGQGTACQYPAANYGFAAINQGSTFVEASGVSDIQEGVVIADFNADGLSDLLIPGTSDYTLKLSKGDGSFVSQGSIGVSVNEGVQVVDYNGDGYMDIYWAANSVLNYKLWDPSATTPGLGSTQQVSNGTSPISTAGTAGFNYNLVDVNSDGRPDLFNVMVAPGMGTRSLAIRKNDGFNQPKNLITEIENGLGAITVVNYESLSQTNHYSRIEGITSGSTTVEVCWDEQQTWYGETYTYEVCEDQNVAVANSSDFYRAMVNPFGGANDTLFTETDNEKYVPVLELMGPMFVVTSVSSSAPANDNAGAFSDISYLYEQAKVQAAGRGVLGFRALTTVDGQTGIKTRTEYRQDWPYIGLPLKTTVSLDGDLISEATNTWSIRNRDNFFDEEGPGSITFGEIWANYVANNSSAAIDPVAPYIALSVEKTYDPYDANNPVLSTVITQNSYDGYGNPTDITVSTYEGEETNPSAGDYELRVYTNNEYVGAGGGAEKGRLSQVTVTTTRKDSGSTVVHTAKSQFEYYSGNQTVTLPGSYSSLGTYHSFKGMLQYEKVLDSSNATVLTKQHYYDQYGNEILTRTEADGQDRYSSLVDYDTTGRFVDTTYELFANNPNTSYSTVSVETSNVMARNNYGMATLIKKTVDATNDESITVQRFISPRGTVYQEADSTGRWTATNAVSGQGTHCPSGTAYHIRTRSAGGAVAYECFDVLARSIHKEVLRFDDTQQDTWAKTDTVYDSLGRVLKVSEPYAGSTPETWAWTVNQYDELGRITQVSEPRDTSNTEPGVTTFVYDGLKTIQTTPRGNTRREERNVLGEIVEVYENYDASSVGGITPGADEKARVTYTYGPRGNLLTLNDHSSPVTTMVYDEFGRKTSMTDPDKGTWAYAYNNFGEQVCQQDAKKQVIWSVYDFAGRMVERKDYAAIPAYSCSASTAPSATEVGITQWEYDQADYGLGQLDAVVTAGSLADIAAENDAYSKTIEYDQYGRLSSTVTDIDGLDDVNAEKTTYDQYGRVFQVFDAARSSASSNGNGIQNHYNSHGYLYKVTSAEYLDGTPWKTYYEVGDMDLRGNVIDATYGDVVEVASSYEADTGYLSWLSASDGSGMMSGMYQNYDLDWDEVGNLTSRRNVNSTAGGSGSSFTNQNETFTYDAMNRLASYTVGGATAIEVDYNNIGNITSKTDWGGNYSYTSYSGPTCNSYATPGPHAVLQANGTDYCYDANGNMVKDSSGRELTYSVYDMVTQITKGGYSTSFAYGPDRGRYMRTDTDGTNTTVTYYIGSVQKVHNDDGTIEWKRDIGVGQITQIVGSNGALESEKTDYFLKDHLGSITHIIHTDSSGAVTDVDEYAFDPWGQRRKGDPQDWTDVLDTVAELQSFYMTANGVTGSFTTTKGFTGHEMLDEMGIIHMNGRIYDPGLGRFLQADPYIQEPYLTASLNRYSYVINNPLNATDPSGYIFSLIAALLAYVPGATLTDVVASTVIAVFAESMAATGGNLIKSVGYALVAGVSANTFGKMGTPDISNWSSIVSETIRYGVVGGITTSLQGGKFGHGFFSAGINPFSNKLLSGVSNEFGRTLVQMAISGTVSEKTGGKFANGAATAAFIAVATGARRVLETYDSGEPSDISDDVTVNPELRDNITVEQIFTEATASARSDGLAIDYGIEGISFYRISIEGSIAGSGTNFEKAIASIRALNGEAAGNGKVVYEMAVDVQVITDSENADWVIQSTSGSSSATPGGSGVNYPISMNSGSGGVLKFSGAHEFLHTFGLWHQVNRTRAITSYAFNRGAKKDYRRLSFSEAHRLSSAYR